MPAYYVYRQGVSRKNRGWHYQSELLIDGAIKVMLAKSIEMSKYAPFMTANSKKIPCIFVPLVKSLLLANLQIAG